MTRDLSLGEARTMGPLTNSHSMPKPKKETDCYQHIYFGKQSKDHISIILITHFFFIGISKFKLDHNKPMYRKKLM